MRGGRLEGNGDDHPWDATQLDYGPAPHDARPRPARPATSTCTCLAAWSVATELVVEMRWRAGGRYGRKAILEHGREIAPAGP